MTEGLVGGEAFAVDASMVVADAHRQRGVASSDELAPTSNRAVTEYLAVLDDAAAVYAYADNYLIDLKHPVIMDVEAPCVRRKSRRPRR
jgi:hypothetical protein